MEPLSKVNPGFSGSGCLFKDCSVLILWGRAYYIGVEDNMYTESDDLLYGIKHSLELNQKCLDIELDSKVQCWLT